MVIVHVKLGSKKALMPSQDSNKETPNAGVSWLLVIFQIQTKKK